MKPELHDGVSSEPSYRHIYLCYHFLANHGHELVVIYLLKYFLIILTIASKLLIMANKVLQDLAHLPKVLFPWLLHGFLTYIFYISIKMLLFQRRLLSLSLCYSLLQQTLFFTSHFLA